MPPSLHSIIFGPLVLHRLSPLPVMLSSVRFTVIKILPFSSYAYLLGFIQSFNDRFLFVLLTYILYEFKQVIAKVRRHRMYQYTHIYLLDYPYLVRLYMYHN